MSASPADRTPGRTPNGTLPPLRRPRPPADPLVRPRRRQPRPGGPQANTAKQNQPPAPARPGVKVPTQLAPRPAAQIQNPAHHVPTLGLLEAAEHVPSGFSSEPVAPYTDYPLVMSKRQLMEGLRHHVARFYSKKSIDPTNEEQFTRPVRLHRRDARALAASKEGEGGDEKEIDEEERERQQLLRAQREAEREAQMAEVAPSASSGGRRLGSSNKKTSQVLQLNQTEEQRARSKLRYEEALQWHLEDFDNKQSWTASYEAALSETYGALAFKDGKFSVVPLEKWYKFTPRLNLKHMPLEEAEKHLEKREKDPEWLLKSREQDRERKFEEMNRKASRKLFVGQSVKQDPDLPGSSSRRDAGFDELDFEEDRFADDEEPDLFEGDTEDLKAQEERIKRDQYEANVFNMKDEKTYDKAELLERKAKLAEKEHGKRVKKALMKREKNFVYDSDSDENPYSEKSESTDSEAERQKEEQEKKEAEEKAKGSQPPSGASTKGNNTPSNRASKHLDPNVPRIKPGSANASDASGNESSRKKQKKPSSSKLGTGANTPNGNKSRSRSPAPSSQDPQKKFSGHRANSGSDSLKKRPRGPGSGSEGEGAGSGGDMSDGSRKRMKTTGKNPMSARVSPGTSRSPSIEPGGRAGSPEEDSIIPMPTAEQITAAIPDAGIPMVRLFKMYGGQQAQRKQELIKLLRPLSRYDSQTKMLKKIKRET